MSPIASDSVPDVDVDATYTSDVDFTRIGTSPGPSLGPGVEGCEQSLVKVLVAPALPAASHTPGPSPVHLIQSDFNASTSTPHSSSAVSVDTASFHGHPSKSPFSVHRLIPSSYATIADYAGAMVKSMPNAKASVLVRFRHMWFPSGI
jgi:hypothetical protein